MHCKKTVIFDVINTGLFFYSEKSNRPIFIQKEKKTIF